jgi:hypothetical protein
MVVRVPIIAYAIWLTLLISPFSIVAIPLVLDFHLVIYVLTLFAASFASRYLYVSLIRNTRRRVLQSLIRRKARTEEKPFVLISRSYDQSLTFNTALSFSVPSLSPCYISLLEALIYDISHQYPLVVLGDKDLHPDDPAGRAIYVSAWPKNSDQLNTIVYNAQTGRLTNSQTLSWEEIFIELARAAQFVLVIPAISEGVQREISLLREHCLGSKTVVYMWPAKGAHSNAAICADVQAWEALREPLIVRGLALPPHHARGALLQLGDDFTLQSIHYPLSQRNIMTLVTPDDRNHTSLREAVHIIENYEIAANPDRFGPMWGVSTEVIPG